MEMRLDLRNRMDATRSKSGWGLCGAGKRARSRVVLRALEILNCSLMSFGSMPRRKRSEVATLAGLRVFLP